MQVERPALSWLAVGVAVAVFCFTAVSNSWYWLTLANRAFFGRHDQLSLGFGIFSLVNFLLPVAAGALGWRTLRRRRRTDTRREITAVLWLVSLMSLLPLVIAAFVPAS